MTLKHDIRAIIIHVLIPWNKVTLFCQIVHSLNPAGLSEWVIWRGPRKMRTVISAAKRRSHLTFYSEILPRDLLLRRDQDVSNTKKLMRSKAERVLGPNQESSLSDEAHRADQAHHCQLALRGLIWELFSIVDRILRGYFCMNRRYILAGNSKWQNKHTQTQSYQHWSLRIIVKQVRNLMTWQVFKSK